MRLSLKHQRKMKHEVAVVLIEVLRSSGPIVGQVVISWGVMDCRTSDIRGGLLINVTNVIVFVYTNHVLRFVIGLA